MDSDALARVLAGTHGILLDFDGPVTPLLPGRDGERLAEDARTVLVRAGIEVPPLLAQTTDHLAVLRLGAQVAPPDVLDELDEACVRGELEAAQNAVPTPGAHAALQSARSMGRPVVIVSNNAGASVEAYLQRNGLSPLVRAVIGRMPRRPDLMKPNVEPIYRALGILSAQPESCVFIGDSVTDIQVSRETRVRSIGYAKTPERGRALALAGADAITDDMWLIASTLSSG